MLSSIILGVMFFLLIILLPARMTAFGLWVKHYLMNVNTKQKETSRLCFTNCKIFIVDPHTCQIYYWPDMSWYKYGKMKVELKCFHLQRSRQKLDLATNLYPERFFRKNHQWSNILIVLWNSFQKLMKYKRKKKK